MPKSIVRDPVVCGGRAVLSGTTVSVALLAVLWEAEAPIELILATFPNLCEEDFRAAIDYANAHTQEIQTDISRDV